MESEPLASPVEEVKVPEELALLIRGFFSLPVMSGLGRLGVLQELLAKSSFGTDDFQNVPNKKLLENSFLYLARLGFLERLESPDLEWRTSELGRQIFQRASSFYVPHSYGGYMEDYFTQLQASDPKKKPAVDRLENIIGSGRTHQRYFPYAVSFLKRRFEFDWIADIGCGDGHFLDTILKSIPNKNAVGIDLSEIAIQATRANLQKKYPDRTIETVCDDAEDVPGWGAKLSSLLKTSPCVISMWFLLHEISNYKPKRVADFLRQIHRLFPKAPLIICEIVRQEDSILARARKDSIMPEYLFFHDLSGQGVLSWKEYQGVLAEIPYQLASERLFDEIPGGDGLREPSSFIWCLTPK